MIKILVNKPMTRGSFDIRIGMAGGPVPKKSGGPGEKQLIGVARAVLRKSRIVALDEVTSRVDKATDEKVQAAAWSHQGVPLRWP